ncbi:helix-turn-helix domain-containing protein [Seohaeicola zhoushanensis]|uniref:XRE family transcriptional regulator n=1 Tax=Seohaeicola zhoushanensis TaxID=1569283 RepID=A0A8J3M6V3_9RHOB|nr:XRE family transcriptional regulator [Seohaeicola zhoushanensis]GHF49224.1 XRE family transcriptional regulator [Seohaeicola zhoushanensis]
MPRDSLTGTRIRERRSIAGLRQADLARQIGISASYLNLIEHNRRRIGGKLLIDIARVLGVEPSMLTEGAEAALIATLREAAADAGAVAAETDRADELAGRFPGWAEVLALLHRRVASLERTVETLSDRLTHDPHLAASLHEVLSTAAAIRSTASILAETDEIDPEWRTRFHRNLNNDSRRLAESSKALVGYLDDNDAGEVQRGVPREEAEAFFAAQGYHFPGLETGEQSPDDLVRAAPELGGRAARHIAREFLQQYTEDALALPLDRFAAALDRLGPDPGALGAELGADLPAILRRIAAMPERILPGGAGLVIADASGSILFRKVLTGFALPRFGAPCPLWPLFLALSRPLVPVRRKVTQLGRGTAHFDCLAISWPQRATAFTEDPLYNTAMLILPLRADEAEAGTFLRVGSSCRVCPRLRCHARREPSILREEF